MSSGPTFPSDSQHVAAAGMNGSGKTWGMLDMLSYRDLSKMAWIVIDNKRDSALKKLPAEPITAKSLVPKKGLYILRPRLDGADKGDIESFLQRIFRHGKIGIYVDEGHLFGFSPMVRNILVAGRDRKVPLMWTSQKANWIDPFVWSQSKFYRVFTLQTAKDVKAVQDNWPVKFQMPEPFHSWYYDGTQNKVHYLSPSDALDKSIERLDNQLLRVYRMI
jgi:hypothetical protein